MLLLAPAELRCDRLASSCSLASPLCSPLPCCRLLGSPSSWIRCHYRNIQYSYCFVLFTWWERRCPPADGILGHPHHNCSLPMPILQKMMRKNLTDQAETFCWVMSLCFIFSMLWYEFMHVPFHPIMRKYFQYCIYMVIRRSSLK